MGRDWRGVIHKGFRGVDDTPPSPPPAVGTADTPRHDALSPKADTPRRTEIDAAQIKAEIKAANAEIERVLAEMRRYEVGIRRFCRDMQTFSADVTVAFQAFSREIESTLWAAYGAADYPHGRNLDGLKRWLREEGRRCNH